LEIAAAAAVALLAVYGYGCWQTAQLDGEAARLESRAKSFTVQIARLDPGAGAEHRKGIEAEIQALNAQLLTRQALAEVLRKHPLGARGGFSAYLAALARRHSDGLWLTQVAIDGATGAMQLAGHSVRAELVPEYLKRLGREPALAGESFDHLKIEQSEQKAGVSFSVSSRAVEEHDPHAAGQGR
ncbi:MAG TPA: PilN domain-containing protein, partial [Gammaproteobacteria bacterium]|nr:PilN domain-containing protein [Gammaproteobacteria bacterium]